LARYGFCKLGIRTRRIMPKTKLLFVCDGNRMRSPTAQRVFSENPEFEVQSAGLFRDATISLTKEHLEWADIIFVMEKRQRNIIHKKFKDLYQTKKIICLYIPDEYEFMQAELIGLLVSGVAPHLPK